MKSKYNLLYGTICFVLLLVCSSATVQAVSVAHQESIDDIHFETHGQSLWGPGKHNMTKTFRANLIHQHERGVDGEIKRYDKNIKVSNAKAVKIWEKALKKCDKSKYKGWSPSKKQCRKGFRYPCPTATNWNKKCSVSGLGSKPRGEIARRISFHSGYENHYDVYLHWGIGGGIELNTGTVDAEYTAKIKIMVNSIDGTTYRLSTSIIQDNAELESEWPYLTGWLDSYTNSRAKIDIRAESLDPSNPTKRLEIHKTIYDAKTNGTVKKRIAGFQIGKGKLLKLQLLNNNFEDIPSRIIKEIGPDLVPPVGKFKVKIPLAEIGVNMPLLDTPAAGGFDGDHTDNLFKNHVVKNSLTPGSRQNMAWLTPITNFKDTDTLLSKFDIAGTTSLAMEAPVGVSATQGTLIPTVNLYKITAKLFDEMAALYFGFRENLKFRPNLRVVLNFNNEIIVSGESGKKNKVDIRVGDNFEFEYSGKSSLDITPDYTILNSNSFINDTDLILSPAIEGNLLHMKVSGLAVTALPSDANNDTVKEHAVGHVSEDFGIKPVKLVDVNFLNKKDKATFPLEGFVEKVTGKKIKVKRRKTNIVR
jgi:hypothetical protein